MIRAESVAENLLDRLKVNDPNDLLLLKQIAYECGAIYRESPLEGSEARLTIGLDKPIITVSTIHTLNPQRRRFSIAHEIGHLEMHKAEGGMMNCAEEDIQYKPDIATKEFEQEANQFAASFLMPKRFVEKPFKENNPSFDLIVEWASLMETSLTATAFRYVNFTTEPVAVVFSTQGNIRYFQPSLEFLDLGVFPDVNSPVGSHTDARKLFQGDDIKKQWRKVRASEWFRKNEQAFDKQDEILEWSLGMPYYDSVLTLLWVNKPLGLYSW